MCGVAGVRIYGKTRPEPKLLEDILLDLQYRGRDATGVAFIYKEGKKLALGIFKAPVSAEIFIKTKSWEEMAEQIHDDESINTVILHTRAKTKGAETDPKNNHPLFSKEGTALVHNGCISNDDRIIAELSWNREGQVDTEAALALVDTATSFKEAGLVLDKMSGTYAILAISTKYPGEMLIARDGSPLCLSLGQDDILLAASTPETLYKATKRPMRGINWAAPIMPCEDDHAYILGDNGLKEHFKIPQVTKTYGRSGYYGNHDNGSETKIYCYTCKHMRGLYSFPPDQRDPSRTERSCYDCRDLDKKKGTTKPTPGIPITVGPRTLSASPPRVTVIVDIQKWKGVPKLVRKELKRELSEHQVIYVPSARIRDLLS